MPDHQHPPIAPRATSWRSVLLVCGKCSRKLDGGFGRKGHDDLRSVLRDALEEAGRHDDVLVVETKCLGLCPKKAVAVLNGENPGRIYAVNVGTDAGDVLRTLDEAAWAERPVRP